MKTQFRPFALGAAIVSAVSLFVGMIPSAGAADYAGYSALDQSQPVSFDGGTVKWNGKTFTLDENILFLGYRLQRAQLAGTPYAFNNLKDAVAKLKHGTAGKPMLLPTAPGVSGFRLRKFNPTPGVIGGEVSGGTFLIGSGSARGLRAGVGACPSSGAVPPTPPESAAGRR